MQATPLFLGACALASIAGVLSGATINTRPIQHGGIGMEEIVRPAIAFSATESGLSEQVALPDHYAVNTPHGRFEVGELANRGLYAQQRFGWRDAAWTPPPEPSISEPEADPGWSAGGADPIVETAEVTPVGDPPVPLLPAEGRARTIDVQTELASQVG
jgi:hypothetical protein